MRIVNYILFAFAILFVTGCSIKEESNQMYSSKASELLNVDTNVTQVKNMIKEKIIGQSYVSTRNKKLSEALSEIGQMTGRNYILLDDDFEIPHTNNFKGVYSFDTLKDYIEDTTDKTIKITKNRLTKNRVKTVAVENKNSSDYYFKNVKFTLSANDLDIRDALNEFSEKVGYSIIYGDRTKDSVSGGVSSVNGQDNSYLFSTPFLSYAGVNALQFLDFLKTSIDIYLEINHKAKMIKISKYKLKEIPLMITNRVISKEGTSTIDTGGSSGSTSSNEGTLNTKIDLKTYETFKTSLENLKTTLNDKTGDKNFVSVEDNTGIVTIYATKSAMNILGQKVKYFNKSYSAQGTMTITTIDLIVKNSYKAGSGLSGNLFSKGDVSLSAEVDLTESLNSAFTMINKSKYTDITTVLQSLKDIGYIAKKDTYYTIIRNHTPSLLKDLEKTNYVKNSTSNVNSTDSSTTVTTTTETEEIQTGSVGVVVPKIDGDTISLYVSLDDVTNEGIVKEKFGDTEINIPTIKPRTFDNEYLLRSGEHRIILNTTKYEDADNYKGTIPLKDVIIGGYKDTSLVRKERIDIISVELDNL